MGMEMTIGIPARSVKDRSAFSGIWQRDNRLCAIKDRASLAGIWQRRYRCMFRMLKAIYFYSERSGGRTEHE